MASAVCALMLVLGAAGDGLQPGGRMVPMVVPVVGSWDNVTNLSWLNERPAGKHGFVQARDGHFVDAAGKRIRFIGGAFCHGASFPPKDLAESVAARLAMTGFNLVRLHHMDGRTAPNGIWRRDADGRPEIDPQQLDRLDGLIAQLKQHGVYANINLKVSRTFRESEGVLGAKRLGKFSKGPDYFDPRMIDLQKQFARDLLLHVNPYTKTRYVDEPAVAFVEINNENSLLHQVLGDKLGDLPEPYDRALTGKWNQWLSRRYGSSAKLRQAWQAGSEPLRDSILANGDFSGGMKGWRFSVQDPESGVAEPADGGPDGKRCLHVAARRPGRLAWTFQVNQPGLDMVHDKLYTLSFWIRAGKSTAVSVCVRLDHRCPRTKRYRVIGLSRSVRAEPAWRRFEFTFRAVEPVKDGNRAGFTFPNTAGEYWIADVQLRPGGMLGLRGTEDLALGTVARPATASGDPKRDPRWLDYVRFIAELDQAYASGMARFLKEDLGVRALVIDTQASYGGVAGILRESKLDYIDMHAYWDHPRFPRKSWDGKDWLIHGRPMVVSAEGGIVRRLACHRVAGKPFVVSEFNHATPNPFAAEAWPIMAGCAAAQDWDGVIVHNYVNYAHDGWREPRIRNYFDTAAHPAKMPLLLAAALMFRRGDVPPAAGSALLSVPEGSVPALTAALGRGKQAVDLWGPAKVHAGMLSQDRLALRFCSGTGEPTVARTEGKAGAVRWDAANEKGAMFTVDAAATKAIVGMVAKRRVSLGPWTMEFGESSNGFAAATLASIDGRPVPESKSLVLAAVGMAGNTGMGWSPKQKMLADWGQAPTLVEAVPARVSIRTGAARVAVHALDGKGDRRKVVPSQMAQGAVTFDIGPAHGTVWYELTAAR